MIDTFQSEPFTTNQTSLAAYLIQSDFPLLEITYQPRGNGKLQGTFVFEDCSELQKHVALFDSGKAIINLVLFEQTKSRLIDKIMARQER